MHIDFLVSVSKLLERMDRVRLLRLSLRLADRGAVEWAHAFYELCPYLSPGEKRIFGEEVLRSEDYPPLAGLVVLTSCSEYLAKGEVVSRIESLADKLKMAIDSTSFGTKFNEGFTSLVLQQGLAISFDHRSDSGSPVVKANLHNGLLAKAISCFRSSPLWLARSELAQGWLFYSLAVRKTTDEAPELLHKAEIIEKRIVETLNRTKDYTSLFSSHRLMFLINYQRYLLPRLRKRSAAKLIERMREHARLCIDIAGKLVEPIKLAGAYTNLGVVLRLQADLEPRLDRRRQLLQDERETYLRAVSSVKGVSNESMSHHLYNAGSVLTYLARTEPNIMKMNELVETALKEMDEVIKLSIGSTDPTVRLSAISTKLYCMDELASTNPVSITEELLAELNLLDKQLEELQPKTSLAYLCASHHMNLAIHCLKLLRASGKYHKGLVDRAEKNALRAYRIAEKTESYGILGLALYNTASILMVKGIANRDLTTLEEACQMAEKSYKALKVIGDAAVLASHSLVSEIRAIKYGYTGDEKELRRAMILSRKSASDYVAHKYSHLAAEELFKLATLHMLADEDEKAEKTLDEAAWLFRKSGKSDPKFRRLFGNYSAACKATRKLVQAHIAYKAGRQSSARRLAEKAEKEMIKANARWREIWLIRGFKELLAGNIQEARNNLTRVIRESSGMVQEENPTSTGYSAKKLANYIDQDLERGEGLPPAAIDLPIRSEVILTAEKLDKLGRQLSSVPYFSAYTQQKELSIEEIRELIKRITKIGDKEGKSQSK